MKIADIRTYCLSTPLETPFAYSQGWVKARGAGSSRKRATTV